MKAAAKVGVEDKGGRALAEDDWTVDYRAGARGWEAVRTAFAGIAQGAKAKGVPVLVILLPDTQDLVRYHERYHPKIEPMVAAAASEAGLPLFDLEPTFQPWQGKEDEVCYKRQRHPNAMGYGVIAKAVAGQVESRYLTRPSD